MEIDPQADHIRKFKKKKDCIKSQEMSGKNQW